MVLSQKQPSHSPVLHYTNMRKNVINCIFKHMFNSVACSGLTPAEICFQL